MNRVKTHRSRPEIVFAANKFTHFEVVFSAKRFTHFEVVFHDKKGIMIMDFLSLASSRYSVRSYDDRPVPDAVLARILEAGRLAPTAKNLQPQRIFVLQSPAALEKLRQITPYAFNAPVVLLLCGDTEEGWKNPFDGKDHTETDVAIVTTHLLLAATEAGLGTCWVGSFDTQKVAETFALPKALQPFALLPLGFPAENAAPSERHALRKPLSETVFPL